MVAGGVASGGGVGCKVDGEGIDNNSWRRDDVDGRGRCSSS